MLYFTNNSSYLLLLAEVQQRLTSL